MSEDGAGFDEDVDGKELDLYDLSSRQIRTFPILKASQEVDLAKAIEVGLFAQERLDKASQTGEKLSAQLTRDLRVLVREGARAKEHMIHCNMRLVRWIARRHQYSGLPLHDLEAEGSFGLIRAVEKFDFTLGYKFSTYAGYWVRQAITNAIRTQARTIRVPGRTLETLHTINVAKGDFYQEKGRYPTHEELASAAGMTPDKLATLLSSTREPLSLNAIIGSSPDADIELGDLIVDRTLPGVEDIVTGRLPVEYIRDAITSVLRDERERDVILRRFGIGREPQTLDTIGEEYGRTRERIRQIEIRAKKRLAASPHFKQLRELLE